VADRWLPLDGILFYQVNREQYGPQIVTIPGDYSNGGDCELPVAMVHPGRSDWYYRCSWAQWAQNIEGRDYWNKRFDTGIASLVDFAERRGKVLIEQGKYKAYHMSIFYRVAEWVEWYCFGDKERIANLLSTVTHLGKKTSQGWGRIRWEIESCENDWSLWQNGKLMRGIPYEDIPSKTVIKLANLIHYGIRPSYWKHENQMMLVMPE
jgi:hypothetical protein